MLFKKYKKLLISLVMLPAVGCYGSLRLTGLEINNTSNETTIYKNSPNTSTLNSDYQDIIQETNFSKNKQAKTSNLFDVNTVQEFIDYFKPLREYGWANQEYLKYNKNLNLESKKCGAVKTICRFKHIPMSLDVYMWVKQTDNSCIKKTLYKDLCDKKFLSQN